MEFYKEIPIRPILGFFIFLPIIFWTIIVYIIWFSKKYKWDLGKKILIPLSLPYIYAFLTFMLYYNSKIPFGPEFKVCFTYPLPKDKQKLKLVSEWNWQCAEYDDKTGMSDYSDMGGYLYYITYAILLVGILCTAFKKIEILNNPLIRNFTILALLFSVFSSCFQWLGTYGVFLYSGFFMFTLSMVLMMALCSFVIILMGLFYRL